MEILAPAGGPEALKAAVFAGADAVYLGGPAFGARANAKNFTREELREAAGFCRARGVKLHVTVNTLLKDGELPQALDFVKFLCSLPADAMLVQDMGLFSLLRELCPQLPLHASTQMSLHTPGGVKLLYDLGASRVVLARELSLEEIGEIGKSCPVELESFLHGALCMSVSGQCWFSAVLGGRSGNRGMCAQTCRLPFSCPGGTGYDLSLKDLSFIDGLDRLAAAGVCSAKIEGRMKRPEYVAAAVSCARRAADGEPIPEDLRHNLEAVFSRSGFTDGYLAGRRGRGMFGSRTRKDVTGATEKVFSSLRGLYRGERRSVPITLCLEEREGALTLTASDREGHTASASCAASGDGLPPLSRERCIAQLQKTGGTPFFLKQADVSERGVRAGVSQINALRREVLDKLLDLRTRGTPVPFAERPYSPAPRTGGWRKEPLPLRACFRFLGQVPEAAKRCESVVLPLDAPVDGLERLRERGFPPILLELPRAMFGDEERVKRVIAARMERDFCDFVCGNLGHIPLGRDLGARLHGAFGLNVFNTAALDFFAGQGFLSQELSFELTGREARGLGGSLPRGLMVYGRIPVMLTRNCPLANSPKGCLHCKWSCGQMEAPPGVLRDRLGKLFPVLCTGEGEARYSEVLNCTSLWLGDRLGEMEGLDFGVCRFTVENPVECGEVLGALFRREKPTFDYTRGLYARGVE